MMPKRQPVPGLRYWATVITRPRRRRPFYHIFPSRRMAELEARRGDGVPIVRVAVVEVGQRRDLPTMGVDA